MATYKAYQIAFDDKSKANINNDFAWTYFQKEATPFFENEVILKLIKKRAHKQADYFAVLSHKFFDDTLNKDLKPIEQKEIEDNLGHTDVVSFFGFKKDNFEIFRHAEKVHNGIAECYHELFRLLGKTYNPLEPMRFVVYRNAFFARSEVYERYVNEILEPCIELMIDKKNHVLWQAIWKDSRYPYQDTRFQKHEGLREKFVHDMGVPYYPFHTFILERMFSYWLNLNPEITCKHI